MQMTFPKTKLATAVKTKTEVRKRKESCNEGDPDVILCQVCCEFYNKKDFFALPKCP